MNLGHQLSIFLIRQTLDLNDLGLAVTNLLIILKSWLKFGQDADITFLPGFIQR